MEVKLSPLGWTEKRMARYVYALPSLEYRCLLTCIQENVPDKVSPDEDSPNKGLATSSKLAKVDDTMRRADRVRINDCKEDIDTLLVFVCISLYA